MNNQNPQNKSSIPKLVGLVRALSRFSGIRPDDSIHQARLIPGMPDLPGVESRRDHEGRAYTVRLGVARKIDTYFMLGMHRYPRLRLEMTVGRCLKLAKEWNEEDDIGGGIEDDIEGNTCIMVSLPPRKSPLSWDAGYHHRLDAFAPLLAACHEIGIESESQDAVKKIIQDLERFDRVRGALL